MPQNHILIIKAPIVSPKLSGCEAMDATKFRLQVGNFGGFYKASKGLRV